jgi:hypothetical protein
MTGIYIHSWEESKAGIMFILNTSKFGPTSSKVTGTQT